MANIKADESMTYNLTDKKTELVIKYSNLYFKGYLTTGVLSKDLAWKFLFKLLKNGKYSDWQAAGILLLGKGILEAKYNDIAKKY